MAGGGEVVLKVESELGRVGVGDVSVAGGRGRAEANVMSEGHHQTPSLFLPFHHMSILSSRRRRLMDCCSSIDIGR